MRQEMTTGRPTADFFIWVERFFGPLYFIFYENFSRTTVSWVKRLLDDILNHWKQLMYSMQTFTIPAIVDFFNDGWSAQQFVYVKMNKIKF